MAITFIVAEGSAVRTTRVEACEVDSHIAANDSLAFESRALGVFSQLEGNPRELKVDGKTLRLQGVRIAAKENCEYVTYA